MKSLVYLTILVAIIWLIVWIPQYQRNSIGEWLTSHGYTSVAIEQKLMDRGPYFLVTRSDTVYKVYANNGREQVIFWVKFGLGRTIKREVGENEYVDTE